LILKDTVCDARCRCVLPLKAQKAAAMLPRSKGSQYFLEIIKTEK
jgi:hypothetical protein